MIATLLVTCADRTGIVAALSSFVHENGGNIIDADQHSENEGEQFFMRLRFSFSDDTLRATTVNAALAEMRECFAGLTWQLYFAQPRPRVAIFCSREAHCLYDLLLRQQLGELAGDIVLVVSNHEDLREVSDHFSLTYRHIPVPWDDKEAAEAEQRQLLKDENIDCLVLARYMQIISPAFCSEWAGRVINIHHSFLPAFAGAKPYHQAKARGVKIVGATAHYATAELDAGPIIAQDVVRVSHRDEVADLIRKGRDVERQVLARALRLHLERRVLIWANRTVVFG